MCVLSMNEPIEEIKDVAMEIRHFTDVYFWILHTQVNIEENTAYPLHDQPIRQQNVFSQRLLQLHQVKSSCNKLAQFISVSGEQTYLSLTDQYAKMQ